MADKWVQLMSEDGTDNLYPTSKMDLLWENASPTSNFNEQTIQLNLSGYKQVYIIYSAEPSTRPDHIFNSFIPVGKTMFLMTDWTYNNNLSGRTYQVTSTGIFIAGSNTICVPYKIYGIK